MITALATLAFLATLWLVVVAAAQTFAESGSRIMAAIKGQSALAVPVHRSAVPVRLSQRSIKPRRAMRAQPKLRAAA
ncbi:MAG: hypothetical protein ABIQ32_01370 [Sphingomicrobium sp.]